MKLFKLLISEGSTVVEVGGHIGYISLYFLSLVGDSGKVITFEPGSNNVRYIQANTQGISQFTLVTEAVSDTVGNANFFIESLTGQNNTLVDDYDVFDENRRNAGFPQAEYQIVTVQTTTLDTYFQKTPIVPAFIKIDVEGAELEVLRGAEQVLRSYQPIVMVEVTRHHDEVARLLHEYGYQLMTDHMAELKELTNGNVFAFHRIAHKDILANHSIRRT
jgi:FkbM family methyltransferase